MFIVYIQHIYSFNVYTNFLYLVYLFIFALQLNFNLKTTKQTIFNQQQN